MSESRAALATALTAVLLTFSVYLIPLFELPPLSQILLLFALRAVLLPLDYYHFGWREAAVGSALMILAAWWPRQKIFRINFWLQPALAVYALALVAVAAAAVHSMSTRRAGWSPPACFRWFSWPMARGPGHGS